jgi:hypothetical protein
VAGQEEHLVSSWMESVGLLDRIREGRSGGPLKVHVTVEDGPLRGNLGDSLFRAGHSPVELSGTPIPASEHRTSNPRVYYCRVAGTHHRPNALSDPRFSLGSEIVLRAEPVPFDGFTIGIWDASGSVQAGYVPVGLSRSVMPLMRSGTSLGGQVIGELRLGSESGERSAINILIAPAGRSITLVEHAAPDARAGSRSATASQ